MMLNLIAWILLSLIVALVIGPVIGGAVSDVKDAKRRAIRRERDQIADAHRQRERHLAAVISMTDWRR